MTAQDRREEREDIATLRGVVEVAGSAESKAREAEILKKSNPEDLTIIDLMSRTDGRLKAAAAELNKLDGANAAEFVAACTDFSGHIRGFKPQEGDANDKVLVALENAGRADVVFDEAYKGAIKEVVMFVNEYAPHVSEQNPKIGFALQMYMEAMSANNSFANLNNEQEFMNQYVRPASENNLRLSKEEASKLFHALHEISQESPMPFKKFANKNGYLPDNTAGQDREIAVVKEHERYQKWLNLVETFDSFLPQDPLQNKWEKYNEIPGPVENPWLNWQEKHAADGGLIVDVSKGAGPLIEVEKRSGFFGTKKGYEAAKPPQNESFLMEKQIAVVGQDGRTYLRKVQCSSEVYYKVDLKYDKVGGVEAVYYKQTGFCHTGIKSEVVGEYERMQQLRAAVAVEGGNKYQVPQMIQEEGDPEPKMQVILMDKETYLKALSNVTLAVKSYEGPPPPEGNNPKALVDAYYEKKAQAGKKKFREQFVNEIAGDDLMPERAQVQVRSSVEAYLARLEAVDPKNETLINSIKESQENVNAHYEDIGRNYGKLSRYNDKATQRVLERRDMGLSTLTDQDVYDHSPAYMAELTAAKQEIASEYFYKKIVLNDVAMEVKRLESVEQSNPEVLNDYLANLDHRIQLRVEEMKQNAEIDKNNASAEVASRYITADMDAMYEAIARPTHDISVDLQRGEKLVDRAKNNHKLAVGDMYAYATMSGLLPEDVWNAVELNTALTIISDQTNWEVAYLPELVLPPTSPDNLDPTFLAKFVKIYNRKPTQQEMGAFAYNTNVATIEAKVVRANARTTEVERVLDYFGSLESTADDLSQEDVYNAMLSGVTLDVETRAVVKEAVRLRYVDDEIRQSIAESHLSGAKVVEARAVLVESRNRRAAEGSFIPADYTDAAGNMTPEGARIFAEMEALKRELSPKTAEAIIANLNKDRRGNEEGLEAVAVEVTPARLDRLQTSLEENLEAARVLAAESKYGAEVPQEEFDTQAQFIKETIDNLRNQPVASAQSAQSIVAYRALYRSSNSQQAILSRYANAIVANNVMEKAALAVNYVTAAAETAATFNAAVRLPDDLIQLGQERGIDASFILLANDTFTLATEVPYNSDVVMAYAEQLQNTNSVIAGTAQGIDTLRAADAALNTEQPPARMTQLEREAQMQRERIGKDAAESLEIASADTTRFQVRLDRVRASLESDPTNPNLRNQVAALERQLREAQGKRDHYQQLANLAE